MFATLSARIFVLAATVTLAGMGLLAWLMMRMHAADMEAETMRGALHLSDTISRSTRYSMLQNRKEDVYEIINTVGAQPGIESIRIFNKKGKITFSTVPGEQGNIVDKETEACTLCHTGTEKPVSQLESTERTHIFEAPDGHRILGLIAPIYNEPACANAACHEHPEKQAVLGVLDVHTSLERIDEAAKSQNRQFLLLTYLLMLFIATACGLFIWRFVHLPVKALIQGTRHIAQGDLKYRIPVGSRSEIGHLAESFNHMANDLSEARKELTDWAQTLENRVDEKAKIIRQAQAKLLQSEKMASLGSLSAVVAHEINNPLSGVLTYTKLVRRLLKKTPDPAQIDKIQQYLEAMELETARCGKIVNNLLAFSRQSAIVVEQTNLNTLIEKTLFLIGHKLRLQDIALISNLDPVIPPIVCDADQIQQAVLAVLINAIEAMPNGGELKVESRPLPQETDGSRWVELIIADTGVGIPDDVLPRLFEPFFTTKDNKKGVGLGLSVVYGIIKRHQGRISVQSKIEHGSTFVLTLPEKATVEQNSIKTGLEDILSAIGSKEVS